MNYQKVLQPQPQFYNNHQVFYENPQYFDESESFIDNVSYSESDGFIGFPMVRSVPSYDIQELYIRNPLATASQMLPVNQRSRRYLNGQHALPPEYVYEFKARPPPHLKIKRESNPMQSCTPLHQQPSCVAPRRSGSARSQTRPRSGNNDIGMQFRSSPTISVEPKEVIPEDIAKRYQLRPTGQPTTIVPKRNMCSSSEVATNYQGRDNQRPHFRAQFPPSYSRSQDARLTQYSHGADSIKPKSHGIIVECDGEVKKMNSEGDATGYSDINELDTIGRIAATLDEDEVEKLSDKHKMQIKEMSKFLIPRVPSSIRSLQEKTQDMKESNEMSSVVETNENEDHKITFRKSLDSILNQLENCETSLNAVRSKFSNTRNESQNSEKDVEEEIFNLKEISDKMAKARDEGNHRTEETETRTVDSTNVRSDNLTEDRSSGFDSRTGSRATTLDDTSALDLHRSKSYIVNLIDRALSKELGTMANERTERFQDLNPIKAVNRIVRNTGIAPSGKITSDYESSTVYTKDEEPTYIKQLKELRWGHFKHIQQEVKRLEDLERFLDHCANSDIITP
ncbi:uncharacterized protein LOC123681177 isoform X1 [Harmonia axyridis]|uniref:uncharacterized protein LOC123681177 isoform X1 n=1 Tax=Harmonia axyridis TaxID=115357 RepID=UPI001E274EBB|nr:uncharacterized protein LOC123681177 isoform X1 [Harmonia axyridis]